MPTLTVIISGDANKLKAEMDKINAWAKKTGQEVKTRLNMAGAPGGTHTGTSGIVREFMVLSRELAQGNLNRAAGSASILAQRLGLVRYLMNPITAAVVALAAGFYAAYKEASALTERLSGLKLPELHVDYIPKHLQQINSALEAQKEINKEVARTVELYGSVANQSKRQESATKDHFDHLRKMNEYSAATEEEKAKNLAKINKDERNQQLADMYLSKANLELESGDKKRQADKILVNSKEHDEEILKQRKKLADEAQKYLDDVQNPTAGAKAKEAIVRGYNAIALTGVSGGDLDRAKRDNMAEARRRIDAANSWQDTMASNDETRKRKDELYKDAVTAAKEATQTGLDIKTKRNDDNQKNIDDATETAAKVAHDKAFQTETKVARGHITENQRMGAYMSQGTSTIIDVNRRQLKELQDIRRLMATNGPGYGPPMSSPRN